MFMHFLNCSYILYFILIPSLCSRVHGCMQPVIMEPRPHAIHSSQLHSVSSAAATFAKFTQIPIAPRRTWDNVGLWDYWSCLLYEDWPETRFAFWPITRERGRQAGRQATTKTSTFLACSIIMGSGALQLCRPININTAGGGGTARQR